MVEADWSQIKCYFHRNMNGLQKKKNNKNVSECQIYVLQYCFTLIKKLQRETSLISEAALSILTLLKCGPKDSWTP